MADYFAHRRAWLNKRALDPNHLALIEVTGNSTSPTLNTVGAVLADLRERHLTSMIYMLRTVSREAVEASEVQIISRVVDSSLGFESPKYGDLPIETPPKWTINTKNEATDVRKDRPKDSAISGCSVSSEANNIAGIPGKRFAEGA